MGILNKKERIIDFQYTSKGRELLKENRCNIKFVAVSDREAQYLSQSFTDLPQFEVVDSLGNIGDNESWFDGLEATLQTHDFDYYDVETNTTSSCVDESFLLSSMEKKLKSHQNLLLEQEQEKNEYVFINRNKEQFEIELGKVENWNIGREKQINNLSSFYNHYDINTKLNYKKMSPNGFSGGSAYKELDKNNFEQRERQSIILNFENTSKNNENIIQLWEQREFSDTSVANIRKLDIIKINENKYIAGRFIYLSCNNDEMTSGNDFIDLYYDTNPKSQSNTNASLVPTQERGFPLIDSQNSVGVLNTWQGNKIKFVKYFNIIFG